MVTHDQHEAFAMADEIGVMFEGRIQQWDAPYNLYHRPANRFVADFIGQGVLLPGLSPRHPCRDGIRQAGFPDIPIAMQRNLRQLRRRLRCRRPAPAGDDGCMTTAARAGRGAAKGLPRRRHPIFLRLASGAEVLSLVPSYHNHAIGEKIGIRLDADHVIGSKKQRSARARQPCFPIPPA